MLKVQMVHRVSEGGVNVYPHPGYTRGVTDPHPPRGHDIISPRLYPSMVIIIMLETSFLPDKLASWLHLPSFKFYGGYFLCNHIPHRVLSFPKIQLYYPEVIFSS